MTLTVKELYIDGVQMPTPALEGLTMTRNKMWSANTGRLENSGEMAGTIVCTKWKLEIKWPPLPMDQVAVIETAISSMEPFHTLKFSDMTGVTRELQVYFGDPTYVPYSYSEGIQYVKDVAVSAIEK